MTDTPDAETEANRQIISRAFEAWRTGTGTVIDVFAPDMTWRIEGHSLAPKEYDSIAFYDSISFNDLWTRASPRP